MYERFISRPFLYGALTYHRLFQTKPIYVKTVDNAPINVKPAGGRRGIGRDFDIFQKLPVKFPTPGQECEVTYN